MKEKLKQLIEDAIEITRLSQLHEMDKIDIINSLEYALFKL